MSRNEVIKVICPVELQFLRPIIVPSLIRIGNNSDGGYALDLMAIKNVDSFLSLGLGENWTFESTVFSINSKASLDVYDDTVSLSFFFNKSIKGFIKFLLLRDSKSDFLARLDRLISYYFFWLRESGTKHHRVRITRENFEHVLLSYPKTKALGLKVDIEGSEWEILNLISNQRLMFEFLIIEFHDFDKHEDELRNFLIEMADEFVVGHLHANNFEGLGANGFPKVFEITLLRAKNVQNISKRRDELPLFGLDTPNAKNRPDFRITFE